MTIFNLFKKNKNEEIKNEFIGRHQQLCFVKYFLNEEVPDLELQIAINKDNSERDKILKKLEEAEKFISSNMFDNYFDVQNVNKNIQQLVNEGNLNCVLWNDVNLKNRCLKIFNDTHKYLKNSLEKKDKIESEKFANLADQLESLSSLERLTNYITLGGLLNDFDNKRNAWIILNSLFYNNGVVKSASFILPPEPAKNEAKKLKDFVNFLLKEKKIKDNDLEKIYKEIDEGLIIGEEVHKDVQKDLTKNEKELIIKKDQDIEKFKKDLLEMKEEALENGIDLGKFWKELTSKKSTK